MIEINATGRRLLWFIGLYAAGLLATLALASVLKAILIPGH